jgi:hypothetical protein
LPRLMPFPTIIQAKNLANVFGGVSTRSPKTKKVAPVSGTRVFVR